MLRRLILLFHLAVWKLRLKYVQWQLRQSGIDPDSLPEIQELRRRYAAGEPLRPEDLTRDGDLAPIASSGFSIARMKSPSGWLAGTGRDAGI